MLKQFSSEIKKVLTILLAVLFVVSLTAVVTSTQGKDRVSSNGKIVDVAIQSFAFNPTIVKISSGSAVRWTNMDSADHTVDGAIFTSGIISKGQNYKFQFTEPGVYNYECSIHPNIKGTVTVVAKK
jgi:plastocyanin